MKPGLLNEKETDYRVILKRSFELRCRRNPKYSLRAFARDLELSPGSLSEVLNGHQGLSLLAARRITKSLGLSSDLSAVFKAMVEARHSRSETQKQQAIRRLKKLNQTANAFVLKEDVYALVADWYHFALLELLRYSKKSSGTKELARRLAISEGEVKLALDRLQRLDLISIDENGITVLKGMVSASSEIPSAAIRDSHRQVIQKALSAIDTQKIEERDFSALMFAMDPKKISEAKTALKDFRRKFLRTFEYCDESAEIYCLSSQLFSLTETHQTL